MSIFNDILVEVHENISSSIHPTISALVNAFTNSLKEPRYQNPLALPELASLFSAFYDDLNSLVVYIYTQLNTNKRLLLANSRIFQNDPERYDYLTALASYSSLSIKKVRRSDPHALFQLRVFAYYKFMTIMDSIEKAQYDLFSASSTGDRSTLYDKVFRFDDKDIRAQKLWSEKVRLLRHLNLPLSSFCESSNTEENSKLDEFFLTLDSTNDSTLQAIRKNFKLFNIVRTPSTKLKYLVKTQKLLLKLLAAFYEDSSKVNNDVLLPAFIFIVIYHLPEGDDSDYTDSNSLASYDLYLNLIFIKNFLNMIDPLNIDTTVFTLNTSLASYNPNDKRRPPARSQRKPVSKNLFELINLDFKPSEPEKSEEDSDSFYNTEGLQSDRDLIDYLQGNYLNNGELQYYLTNYEAILHFLLNSTLDEIVPDGFNIPDYLKDSELMTKPLHKLLEEQTQSIASLTDDDVAQELDETRSRSGSFLNTISSAVQSVNRSRSNSGAAFRASKDGEGEDFESSIYATPFASRGKIDQSSLGRMRNILGKLGSVSNIQFTQGPFEEEPGTNGETNADGPKEGDTRTRRANTFFERLSPNPTRTRSGSLENSSGSFAANHSRKSTLTKFSSGVTEFMTKLSTAAATPVGPGSGQGEPTHNSNPSLHSLEEQSPFEDESLVQGRPPIGERSLSLHTMDRWFHNLGNEEQKDGLNEIRTNLCAHHMTSSDASNALLNNGDSVFTSSTQELTKFHEQDFDTLTIHDLKMLKSYYDQMCTEYLSSKTGSKTSNEYLPQDSKEQTGL